MSCDFGPIPFPTSPLQTYWEEHYFSTDSTANPSRSAPVTKSEKDNIAPRLIDALEKLAEEQQREQENGKVEDEEATQTAAQKAAAHRRKQSLGHRLLSGGMELWSQLAGEQGGVQKVSLLTRKGYRRGSVEANR